MDHLLCLCKAGRRRGPVVIPPLPICPLFSETWPWNQIPTWLRLAVLRGAHIQVTKKNLRAIYVFYSSRLQYSNPTPPQGARIPSLSPVSDYPEKTLAVRFWRCAPAYSSSNCAPTKPGHLLSSRALLVYRAASAVPKDCWARCVYWKRRCFLQDHAPRPFSAPSARPVWTAVPARAKRVMWRLSIRTSRFLYGGVLPPRLSRWDVGMVSYTLHATPR